MTRKKESLQTFIDNNRTFFDDRLVQTFLAQENNYALLEEAIEDHSKEASDQLDEKFKIFYLEVRMIHYVDKLARFYSKTYDQKKRKQQTELIFHQPSSLEAETNQVFGDTLPDTAFLFDDQISRSITDLLPTEEMKETFTSFSQQKQAVIYLYTFHQCTTKEIAEILGCTTQNVSKLKQKALLHLKEEWDVE